MKVPLHIIALAEHIANMDVSRLKDGEVENVNVQERSETYSGDYGVDKDKSVYVWTGSEWKLGVDRSEQEQVVK